jgi:molybdopterin/thiamine biosynthesis adenylyltransferase
MSILQTEGRFARHRLIEGFSQDLVSSLKLAVVGAGAIGNEMIKNLLLMGAGAIDVFDFDTVELSNLTRSVFLRESDLGLNKAKALVARARELHPATKLRALPGDIRRTLSLSQFASYDMVIAAVDNLEARLRINDMALLTSTAWINIAIDARHAVVELFPFHKGERACYACSLPDSAFEKLAARYSCGGLQRAAWLDRKIPTTAITASVGAAFACSEALRFFHQKKASPKASDDGSEKTLGPGLFGGYRTDAAQRVYLDTITPTISRTMIRKAGAQRGCPGCALLQPAKSLVKIVRRDEASDQLASSTRLNQASVFAPTSSEIINQELSRIAQRENCPLESLQITMSDPLILSCTCTQCQAHSDTSSALSTINGRRAREQNDSIAKCPHCQNPSLEFEISESLSWAEFQNHFANNLPDCAWLSVREHCLDLAAD